MKFSRRRFLGMLSGATALGLAGQNAVAAAGWAPRPEDLLPGPAFRHGVASGDPHTKYVDLERNGYMVVDIDAYRARAEYYHIEDVLNPSTGETLAAAVEAQAGTNHAVLLEGAVAAVDGGSVNSVIA